MTKSHNHQHILLFNHLLKRAQSGGRGLSKGAMALAYDFVDEEQLNHALQALVASGRIGIEIDGRFPAIRINQSKYHALQKLKTPLFLSPGQSKAEDATIAAAIPKGPIEPVKMPPYKFQEPPKPSSASASHAVAKKQAQTPPPPANVAERPAPAKPAPSAPASAVEAALQYERQGQSDSTVPLYAQFRISRDDAEWLLAEIDRSEESIAFPALCKQMFQAELDRRRSPDGMKHKLTADVIRAAREEQRDLGEFVTAMIAVGMAARAMNRRGV